MPSISALICFDAVARSGTFTQAATNLNLTQGAVSRQVGLLEDQLGVQLFERGSRGVELTSKGASYAEGVADVLERIRSLSLDAMSYREETGLSLAILPTFGTRWLMPRIPDFVKKYPDITISFATRIGHFDFQAEALDAAIHIGYPDWHDADCQYLMSETVTPVCSPSFLSEHPVTSPGALLEMPLIEMKSRPNAWRDWFSQHDVAGGYRGGMRFEQFASVAQACIGGLGIALMPVFLIESELASGQLVEAGDWRLKSDFAYYFVRPQTRLSHTPAQRFATWLAAQVEEFLTSSTVSF